MKKTSGVSTQTALLGGMAFGVAWYVGAQSAVAALPSAFGAIPVLGAVGFAVGVSAFLLRYKTQDQSRFAVLDLLPDEIWIMGYGNGLLAHVNTTALTRRKLISAEILGRSIWDVMPEEQHAPLRAALKVPDVGTRQCIRS